MERGNISEFLVANPEADRLKLLRQVAEGLRYLHDKCKLVHGNIKCPNVLIGNDHSAKLADFGLSTLMEWGGRSRIRALHDSGSLPFQAPEHLHDTAERDRFVNTDPVISRSKTTSSDVYAFATLVYQCYTGSPPWADLPEFEIFERMVAGQAPPRIPEDACDPAIGDGLWDLCLRCWNLSPQSRPTTQSVLERLTDLGRPKA
ncbi:kinase-like protein [Auricularia subglabra TFB-10046 SS5]|nr:kinase-like protein [Auricularia subglabra TFB-10046 SS5]